MFLYIESDWAEEDFWAYWFDLIGLFDDEFTWRGDQNNPFLTTTKTNDMKLKLAEK